MRLREKFGLNGLEYEIQNARIEKRTFLVHHPKYHSKLIQIEIRTLILVYHSKLTHSDLVRVRMLENFTAGRDYDKVLIISKGFADEHAESLFEYLGYAAE